MSARGCRACGGMGRVGPLGPNLTLLAARDLLALFVLLGIVSDTVRSSRARRERIPSVQPSSAAMSCSTWNFFGSLRSSIKKCRKWFVTICLSTLSSGFPRLRKRRALVRWSFSITASCRSLPIKRFFSLTSFSKGRARSSSLRVASRSVALAVAADLAASASDRSASSWDCEFSTSSRNSRFRAVCVSVSKERRVDNIVSPAYHPGYLAEPVAGHPQWSFGHPSPVPLSRTSLFANLTDLQALLPDRQGFPGGIFLPLRALPSPAWPAWHSRTRREQKLLC